ncbi:hsp90-like protein [Phlyctema vagabunda]|uniref:Hsp90-like protein n=1 Tax=Phlyctema vagabunda TaxID=108571 RepID=A0ABR4PF79_9HELO
MSSDRDPEHSDDQPSPTEIEEECAQLDSFARRRTEQPRNKSPASSVPMRSSSNPSERPRLPASAIQNDFNPTQAPEITSSYSVGSDYQLGNSDPSADRVFPIRSVVSVDHTQTPSVLPTARNSLEQEYFTSVSGPGAAGQDIAGQRSRKSDAGSVSSSLSGRKKSETPSTTLNFGTPKNTRVPTEESNTSKRNTSVSTNRSGSDKYGGGSRMQLFSDATSDKSTENAPSSSFRGASGGTSLGARTPTDQESIGGGLMTARFKHIVTAEGHAVITGRDGETLQRCEDEPIHIPGAVQSFGLLIALEEQEEGQLVVRIVSENSHRMIGYTPAELFKLKSFTDILSEEQSDNLLDHVDFIQDDDADPATNGPEVFTISIRTPKGRSAKMWCALHINPSNPRLVVCEFEYDDDHMYPLVPPNEVTPEPPEDTLNSKPTQEEYFESTHNASRPLRVLRSARKRKGEAAAMEVFNIMSQVQEQLASAANLDSFLKILVGVVKELTGFHRVMIYQFDAAFNGRVVTELVDPRATKDLYKGLNFPASDIPKQARDMYKVNKVRLLYDRDLETARLVCRTVEDLETPLDLSYSYLRAMSPIHIKYLANMAVRSSMSISITAFGELWGLIACHSYGSKGMRVSFPIRKMCRLVGDTASRNIERLSYASRLQARKLINTVPTETNPAGYITASSDDLLTLFDADFGLLSIRGETKILGKLEHSQEALAMLEYLRLRKLTSVVTSQDIKDDFPDIRYSPGFTVIAGLLLVPLSVGGTDFIVFFRKSQIKEVKWAGNPYEKFVKEGTEGYLEPRKSFATWKETVIGKCRDWNEEQIETAAVLCLVYGKFIEVWRQKEAALQSSQLTKLLLANSAHEVRTPLNAIINYLEIAMEGALDQETRENLTKSHSASKSLIYVINDLLDLTNTEEGQDLVKDEVFDLHSTVHEVTDQFSGDAKRKGINYEVAMNPGVPQHVHGDQRRVRQALSNLTANAMQHTFSGWVKVELWRADLVGQRAIIEIVVSDSGVGMSNHKLDSLFRDLEQVSSDSSDLLDTNGAQQEALSKGDRTLGLGLAIVARVVRNMDGQLRLKSEEGKGSRFVVQLPFELPDNSGEATADNASGPHSESFSLPVATPPPGVEDGEVTLVDKGSSMRSDGIARKKSIDDVQSMQSFKSGSSMHSNKSVKSDVDRLIDAISGPLSVGGDIEPEPKTQRSNSKGSTHSRLSVSSVPGAASPSRTSQQERPSNLVRSRSYGSSVPEHLRSAQEGPPGSEFVVDNKTMMKAVRMPDEFNDTNDGEAQQPPTASRVLFDLSDQTDREKSPKTRQENADHLQVLVAEDDPVNSRIIKKRLEKSGHDVYHTVNGEECASAYGEKAAFFDVVLMDMQMPIVDGLSSTKMIRSFEKAHRSSNLSSRAAKNGRVPIFAVSASLLERNIQMYIDAGFDGWILKPIDFKRLNSLLGGIVDDDVRNACIYQPGKWEVGGWFQRRQLGILRASTFPSGTTPVQNPPPNRPETPLDDDETELSGSTIRPMAALEQDDPVDSEESQGTAESSPTEREMEDVTEEGA